MTCGIYCYIDKKDNSIVYVGKDSHIDKNKRNLNHYYSCNYNQQQINRVLQNNPSRYTYQVLVWNVTNQDTLNALETQYITHLKPKFNFTKGGDGMVGFTHSDGAKERISKNNIRFWEGKKGQYHCRYGKEQTKDTRQKISQKHNNTGFYCVSKLKNKKCKNGFTWTYRYRKNNDRLILSSVDFFKLKEKVLAKNLEWYIIDEEKAQKTLDSLKNE